MREILFRGKRVDNGEWVEGFLVPITVNCYDKGYEIIEKGGINYDELDYYHPSFCSDRVIPETVGQYTGLTDKDGTKIFEGDIVRQYYSKTINARFDPDTLGFIDADDIEGHHIGVVKISSYNGVGMRNPISYDDINGTEQKVKRFVGLASYRCEIIGNIHDNPELLQNT